MALAVVLARECSMTDLSRICVLCRQRMPIVTAHDDRCPSVRAQCRLLCQAHDMTCGNVSNDIVCARLAGAPGAAPPAAAHAPFTPAFAQHAQGDATHSATTAAAQPDLPPSTGMEWSPLEAQAASQRSPPAAAAFAQAQHAGAAADVNVSFAPEAPSAQQDGGFTFAKPAGAGLTPPPLHPFGAEAPEPAAAAAFDFAAHFKQQRAAAQAQNAEGMQQRDDSAGVSGRTRAHRQAPGVKLRHRAQATGGGRTTSQSPMKANAPPVSTQHAEPVGSSASGTASGDGAAAPHAQREQQCGTLHIDAHHAPSHCVQHHESSSQA